jgi:hypothetical protein
MKPDRENYVIWLTDWLEGTLDQEQTEQFLSFLEENPDIKEEAESMSFIRLSSLNDHFTKKEHLKRSPADITSSQIEYLSVAFLEKDLSAEQLADLIQNIDLNQENKKLFESVQKIRLVPQDHHFSHKNNLIKLTARERIFRFSAIGLSAAAAIALLILSYIFVPKFFSDAGVKNAQNISPDTNLQEPIVVENKVYVVKPEESVVSERIKIIKKQVPATSPDEMNNQPLAIVAADIPSFERSSPVNKISGIPELSKTEMILWTPENILVASNNNFTEPVYDEDRSRLSRFIARTFREKILKEKIPAETPLKSYEFAEAGIEGLNKLLGWEMALVKTNDENGELKSVYFSSKLLKFNAPVKKAESMR